jgi:Skp1 family, dimerisation domain
MAASYLIIPGLIDVTARQVANLIKSQTHGEIRKPFNMTSNFTSKDL